jgi:hypothetical protein
MAKKRSGRKLTSEQWQCYRKVLSIFENVAPRNLKQNLPAIRSIAHALDRAVREGRPLRIGLSEDATQVGGWEKEETYTTKVSYFRSFLEFAAREILGHDQTLGVPDLKKEKEKVAWSLGWKEKQAPAISPPVPLPRWFPSDNLKSLFTWVCRGNRYYALAIRMFGSAGECYPLDKITVEYTHDFVKRDSATQERIKVRTDRRLDEIASGLRKGQFYNGPHTRLIGYELEVRNDHRVGKELDHLTFKVGPIGWFEYEGLNGPYRDVPFAYEDPDSLFGLKHILDNPKRLKLSDKLATIICTVVTIVAKDGLAMYVHRSGDVDALPRRPSSCVAENINRYKDLVLEKTGDRTPPPQEENVPPNYRPPRGSIPHPFAAAQRGVWEEVTDRLRGTFSMKDLKLLGMAFDLEALNPHMLFMLQLDLAYHEILDKIREAPPVEGWEWTDSRVVPDTLEDEHTKGVLSLPNWSPSGLACLYRTLEYLDATRGNPAAE